MFAASRAQRERRVKMVSLVSRVTWESRETGERSAWSGLVERTALRVLKVDLVPTENPVPLVLLEKRGNWVFQDCPVIQEDKDQRDRVVSLDSREPMERKEPGALQVNPVQEGREDQRVLVEDVGQEVRQGNQVLRARQATTDPRAPLEREGLKDLRGQWASPDQRVLQDLPERTVCPDTQDSAEKRVFKEKLVPPAQEVLSVPRAQLERRVPSEREATLDPRAHPVSKVYLVQLARRERREILGHRERLERMVLQV